MAMSDLIPMDGCLTGHGDITRRPQQKLRVVDTGRETWDVFYKAVGHPRCSEV